jgi:hypothetical protein
MIFCKDPALFWRKTGIKPRTGHNLLSGNLLRKNGVSMIKRLVMLVVLALLLVSCGRNTPEPTLEVQEVTATTRPSSTPAPPP